MIPWWLRLGAGLALRVLRVFGVEYAAVEVRWRGRHFASTATRHELVYGGRVRRYWSSATVEMWGKVG